MLHRRTATKFRVIKGRASSTKALREIIDEDVLPSMYGGKGIQHFYDSEEERAFFQYVAKLNS